MLRNDLRYRNARTLVLSGERAQESSNRAKYAEFEPDDADGRKTRHNRHIDRWRAVHQWQEDKVWGIMERFNIHPHPCYYLGWSRCSCASCVFCTPREFASFKQIRPGNFDQLAGLEQEFGYTIKRGASLPILVDDVDPFPMDEKYVRLALSKTWDTDIELDPWLLPQGAYQHGGGPT